MGNLLLNSKESIVRYISENNIKTPVELADKKLEFHFNSKENKKHKEKIDSWLDILEHDIEEKYFEVYKSHFKLARMLNDYYIQSIFTESAIKKAMILEHGRTYADGFSGIRVKNNSYTDEYVIEILDGENGQLFCKKYTGSLPSIEQILVDSVFFLGSLSQKEQGNLYSILDFFK